MHETRVLLGLEDGALQEEILHFLDRLPRVSLVGATENGTDLTRAAREHRPEAVVVSPAVLSTVSDLDGTAILVVSPRETTAALRAALKAGATGFYLWPDERDGLGRDAERIARPRRLEPVATGRVIAVHAPRGGSGCTFLATNLAAACADQDAETVLVDLDPFGGDVTAALGLSDENVPTVADLAPVADELTEEHVDRVLHSCSRGFRVLLAPHSAQQDPLGPTGVGSAIRLLKDRFDAVILHLPRMLGPGPLAAVEACDVLLLVITLDVLGLRAARRTVDLLRGVGLDGRCRVVVNRASRGEIVPGDAEQALGLGPVTLIRHDRAVPLAQNRGRLVAGRGSNVGRRVAALARDVLAAEGAR